MLRRKLAALPAVGADALKPPPLFRHSNKARVGNNFKNVSKIMPAFFKKNSDGSFWQLAVKECMFFDPFSFFSSPNLRLSAFICG